MYRFFIQQHVASTPEGEQWKDLFGFRCIKLAEEMFTESEQARLDGTGRQVKHRLIERREEVLLHPMEVTHEAV